MSINTKDVDAGWDDEEPTSPGSKRNYAMVPYAGIKGNRPVKVLLPNYCPLCGDSIVVSGLDKRTGYSDVDHPCVSASWAFEDIWAARIDNGGLTCAVCRTHQPYANETSEMAKTGLCYSCRQTNMWRVKGK